VTKKGKGKGRSTSIERGKTKK